MPSTRLTVLGSGDAFFAGGRHQAGYLLESESATLLLDCGSATLASMKHHGVDPARVDAVFLSHLHGDHFSGLPFLMLEYLFSRPRSRKLTVAGPPGTAARTGELFRAMYRDLASRKLPFELEFLEMLPSRPVEFGNATVLPFRVPHQEDDISLGMRVQIDGKAVVYSGDTGWTDALPEHSAGSDLFVCECCYFESRQPFHLDYPRIVEMSPRFGTRRLVLTHLGAEVLARTGEIGHELAHDGLVIEL